MPEWLVERGIGETRSARIVDGEIAEVRIELEGIVRAGTVLEARLRQSRPQAIAVAHGQDYLLPKGAPGIAEGSGLAIEVTRELIPGAEPWKRPLARLATQSEKEVPDSEGLPFPSPVDRLGEAGWWDLIDEARSGVVRFAGGELRLSATPAMTLIDIDGHLPPAELALAGARAATSAILRHDIGGSIGIDLPTIFGKSGRTAVAQAVDALLPQPFERTAVNGFGFLQIVRPRRRASLLELAVDRAPFEARVLLRRAAFDPAGPKRLVAQPAVINALEGRPEWIETLSRQVGGTVALRADSSLPISGGHAEPA